MITIFPGRRTNESPKDPFATSAKLPFEHQNLEVLRGLYSIIIVVPVMAAVTAAV